MSFLPRAICRVLLACLISGVFPVVACGGAQTQGEGEPTLSPVGATQPTLPPRLPDVELESLDGGYWSLSSEDGNIVVIHFFGTFDGPSQALAPAMERTHIQYLQQNVTVVGVSMDPDVGGQRSRRTVVEAYCALNNLTFDVVLASEELLAGESGFGRIPVIPSTLVLNHERRLAATFAGPFHRSQLTEIIDVLLAE